ncbi:MAG TPA: hypothetical protein VJ724_00660 [Tahibacter sp.]|nr:hypothetical protein [Tahibacter sp.]
MRQLILVVSFIGLALFASLFALSYTNPLAIERGAREVVRLEIERRVGEKIDALTNSRIAAFAERALAQTDVDVADARRVLRDDVPQKIADVVANMTDPDCACRERIAGYLRASANERLASLGQLRTRLGGVIESAYAHVAASLMREFRIFTGANALAFALLALTTVVRRRAALQTVLPAVAIVGAVVVVGSLYLFRQNWLHTVVFNDYVGFAYAAWLAVAALLLADILMNRARVTTRIVDAMLDVVGSAAS